MNYLTKQDVKNVIAKLIDFEAQLNNLYAMQGINIEQNTGRRNMLLSPVQEKEIANPTRFERNLATGSLTRFLFNSLNV